MKELKFGARKRVNFGSWSSYGGGQLRKFYGICKHLGLGWLSPAGCLVTQRSWVRTPPRVNSGIWFKLFHKAPNCKVILLATRGANVFHLLRSQGTRKENTVFHLSESVYPVLHKHWYPPAVFMHFWLHLCRPSEHSSSSRTKKK